MKKRTILILVAIACLLFFSIIFMGHIYLTADSQAARSLHDAFDGEFTTWNPYVFSGMNCWGSLQYTPYLYFVEWPFKLLPGKVFHVLHLIFAAIGFILFAKRTLKVEEQVALFGAVIYAFSLQMIGYEVFGHGSKMMTAAYIPWIFWGISGIINKPSLVNMGILGLLVGLQVLRGHLQIVYYTLLFSVVFVLFMRVQLKTYRYFIGAGVLAALLSAVLWVPVLEYVGQSTRGGGIGKEMAMMWSLHPAEIPTIFFPWLYGFGGESYTGFMEFTGFPLHLGGLALLFAVIGLKNNLKNPIVRFMLVMFGLSLFIAMGKYTPIYDFFYDYLPGFSRFRVPSMIMIMAQFSVAFLAMLGIKTPSKSKNRLYLPVFVAVLMLLAWEYMSVLFPEKVAQNAAQCIIYGCVMWFAFNYLRTHEQRVVPIALGVVVLEIFFLSFYLPLSVKKPIVQKSAVVEYLKNDDDVFRVFFMNPFNRLNEWAASGIETIGGYNPAKPADYQAFIDSTGNFSKITLKQLGFLNVKYVVTPQPIKGVESVESWIWWWGRRVKAYIYQVDPFIGRVTGGTYERLDFDAFKVTGEADTVYISERYDPGWRCENERGDEIPILKNGLMMKVVERGQLFFKYVAPGFYLGFGLSVFSVVVISCLAVFGVGKKMNNRELHHGGR